MKQIFLAVMLFAAPAAAQTMGNDGKTAGDPRGRPMHEMQGDCSNYRTDLKREFELWPRSSEKISAIRAGAETEERLRRDQKTTIRLLPDKDIAFVAPPSENRRGADKFGGVVRVALLAAGTWRVSASSGVWIDLATSRGLLEAPSFEMQTKCVPIFKTVTFRVAEEGPVFLQLNGAKDATVDVLLTRVH